MGCGHSIRAIIQGMGYELHVCKSNGNQRRIFFFLLKKKKLAEFGGLSAGNHIAVPDVLKSQELQDPFPWDANDGDANDGVWGSPSQFPGYHPLGCNYPADYGYVPTTAPPPFTDTAC